MSDYVKKKVIRYPIDAEVAIVYKCDDFWDLENKFKEIDKDFGNWKLKPRFELDSSYNSKQGKSRYYLDYILNIDKYPDIIIYNNKEIKIEFDAIYNGIEFIKVQERFDTAITMQELKAINEKCKELGWNV